MPHDVHNHSLQYNNFVYNGSQYDNVENLRLQYNSAENSRLQRADVDNNHLRHSDDNNNFLQHQDVSTSTLKVCGNNGQQNDAQDNNECRLNNVHGKQLACHTDFDNDWATVPGVTTCRLQRRSDDDNQHNDVHRDHNNGDNNDNDNVTLNTTTQVTVPPAPRAP